MKLEKFEIKIGWQWQPVRGTTLGMKPGWLSWTDGESSGLARPGTWRELKSKPEVSKIG